MVLIFSKEEAEYKTFPELEPYTSTDRHAEPKEDFKTVIRKLENILDVNESYRVADIGCANGELLYFLQQKFPHWELHGYDTEEEYLETAKSIQTLSDVDFHYQNLFDVTDKFDIVISTLLVPTFKDGLKPLKKMLDLCRDGGYLLVTGLFNEHPIDVRVEFRDNSHPETKGQWRTDFNRHSQQMIRSELGNHVQELSFEKCPFRTSIQKDSDNPIRIWTLEVEDGNTLLVNGAGQILNQTLMTVRK